MVYPMYIDGEWVTKPGAEKEVISPATGEALGTITPAGFEEVDRALKAADREKEHLESMTVFERAELCMKIAAAIENHKEELAKIISLEMGKPYTEALGEVGGSALSFRDAAEQIKWMSDEIPSVREKNVHVFAYRRPVGVFTIITPFNFPICTACCYYLAPGLAAGNTMVWFPPISCSAIASVFMKCIEEAGVPKGMLNMVIGTSKEAKTAAVQHPLTAGIGFTGSTLAGDDIEAKAKAKKTLMELGGNGPVVVLKDADLEKASEAILAGSFNNAGQICTSTERVLVDDCVAGKLAELLVEKMKRYQVGNPLEEGTTMGPVHNHSTVDTVLEHIQDAVQKGAKIISPNSGKMEGMPTDNYLYPTVLDFVSKDALVNIEETFGPLIALVRFQDEAEIMPLIEMSPYGLAAGIFTEDLKKGMKMAEKMRFGYVNINSGSHYWDWTFPAGGAGGSRSGHGRSGGKWSILEMSEERCVTVNLND